MLFRKRPTLSKQRALAAKPVQLVKGELSETPDGGGKLQIPLRQARWSGWLFRVPQGATKTFELDALGMMVWGSCDGKTSVQQIIRRLAKRYNLSLREAEVPTIRFLQMLAKKGLVGLALEERDKASQSKGKGQGE